MALKIPKRQQQHRSIARSRLQEKELAKRVGGQRTVASGALDVKGDVRLKRVLRIEAKTTSKESFRVTTEMLGKIETAALASNELPAFVVEFTDARGKVRGSVAVVPLYVLEMMGAWKEGQ
jgi:hypothetical protein